MRVPSLTAGYLIKRIDWIESNGRSHSLRQWVIIAIWDNYIDQVELCKWTSPNGESYNFLTIGQADKNFWKLKLNKNQTGHMISSLVYTKNFSVPLEWKTQWFSQIIHC